MRAFISLVLATLGLQACAADPALNADPTCHIDAPLIDAGEGSVHAQMFKVYPRKSAIGAQFNGCQTLWLYARGSDGLNRAPVDFLRFYFANERVVAARIDGAMCRYSDAGIPEASNGAACPHTVPDAVPSQPAGCISASQPRSDDSCDYDG